MTALADKSRLEIKIAGYGVGTANALSDPMLVGRVQEYRRQAGSRMMALDKPGIRSRIPAGEYHVSLKVDGEFNVLVYDGGEILTVNPGGTVRMGLPWMEEAAALLAGAGVKQALMAGELYVARSDGKRPRVHDVSRVARKPETADELQTLCFAVFDVIELDGKPAEPGYARTWQRITEIFGRGNLVQPVRTQSCASADEIDSLFANWVEKEGGEGLVARSDVAGLFKIKPVSTLDVVAVGFTEGTEDRVGLLHDVLVAIMRPEGTFHILGRVGGGFSEEQRRAMLSDLKDMECESDYAEINADRVAYRMVRPEVVMEITCLDLISQTTRGGTVDRMVLDWDGAAGCYRVVRRLPLASIISPQFVRIRDDKKVVPEDLRIQQVTDLVEVALADRDARQLTLPAGEVMRRQVCTKTLKGAQLVRKLVMWKTNKESLGEDYPAFVLSFTDFSPNRKTPLERDIRVSNSQEQIEAMWEEMSQASFVKGWNPV